MLIHLKRGVQLAKKKKHNLIKYLILFAVTYFIIDFITAFNWDAISWLSAYIKILFLPIILPGLFFYYVIYQRQWEDWKIFTAMMVYALFIEAVVLKNPLIFTFPSMLWGIPLAADFYGLIVFLPKWIVDKQVKKHKILIAVMTAIFVLIAILSYLNKP
jgi:hypothetical protein